MSKNYILEANLFDALVLAANVLKEKDAKISPTFRSCFRAGIEENIEQIRKGNPIYIR